MVISMKLLVLKFWNFWIGLFEPVPYGDPYVASMALFMVLVFACTYFFNEPTS